MFIISALTLAFLRPRMRLYIGVSVSYSLSLIHQTLLSTQFFDVNSETANDMSSSRFWLYWAVTVPLTTITTAGARIFYHLRDGRMRERLCLARQGSQLANIEKKKGLRKSSDTSGK
ncbi:hypothetical protein PMIN03_004596 [Paraphaeosphaeria minitans]